MGGALAVRSAAWAGVRRLLLLLLGIFLLLPTIFIFPLALNSGGVLKFPPDGISLTHVDAVLSSSMWRDGFITSFKVGLLAVAIATVLGTACALLLPAFRRPWRGSLEMLAVSPFVVPPVVLAVGWFALFSRFHLIGTVLAVAIGHALLGLPIVYLNVSAGLSTLDTRLVLASRSLGASRLTSFFLIVVPLVAPSVIAGALLTFVLSIDELIVALFVGGGVVGTLPVVMWSQINYVATPDIAAAAALTVILSLTGLGLAALSWLLIRKREAR